MAARVKPKFKIGDRVFITLPPSALYRAAQGLSGQRGKVTYRARCSPYYYIRIEREGSEWACKECDLALWSPAAEAAWRLSGVAR